VLRRAICEGLLVGALLFNSLPRVQAAQDLPSLTQRVLDRHVLPRYAALASATSKLAGSLEASCSGDKAQLKSARKDFEAVVRAWAEIGYMRFGPMSALGRPERFFFWPDPRGVVNRQLARLTGKRDPEVLNPKVLADKSVAVQGLPALEILMWNEKRPLDGDSEDVRYRCALAVAIAQNLSNLARDISSEWTSGKDWRGTMQSPGQKNPLYKSPTEPAADLVRALVTGLQLLQDQELAVMIAAQPGKTVRVPFERSGLSGAYTASAVASLKSLYEALDLAQSTPKEKRWMPTWIKAAFVRLADDLPNAVETNAGGFDDPDRTRTMRVLRFHVEGIRKLVGRELAPLAGVTIGFNELDGD